MNVLVDTPVWSLALRRRSATLSPLERQIIAELRNLIEEQRARIIGPVRQEILSGVREIAQYEKLRNSLGAFTDESLETSDFEMAANFSNQCRSRGVAGSPSDFLICAVGKRREWPIFTCDGDFNRYSRILAVQVYTARPAIH